MSSHWRPNAGASWVLMIVASLAAFALLPATTFGWSSNIGKEESVCPGGCSRGGGSSGGSYYNPGPSPAELEQQRREAKARALNNSGTEAYDRHDYALAITLFEEALSYRPNSSLYQQNLRIAQRERANHSGYEAYNRHDYASAIKLYEEALSYTPNDSVLQENLRHAQAARANDSGYEAYKRHDNASAIKLYEEALSYSPNDSGIQQNLRNAQGFAAMQREDYAGVERAFREILRLSPNDVNAHHNLIIALIRTLPSRSVEDVLVDAKQAFTVAPNDPYIREKYATLLNLKGDRLSERGRLREAEQQYREAIKVNPDVPSYRADLGNNFLAQGNEAYNRQDYDSAIKLYGEALSNNASIAREYLSVHDQLRLNQSQSAIHQNLRIAEAARAGVTASQREQENQRAISSGGQNRFFGIPEGVTTQDAGLVGSNTGLAGQVVSHAPSRELPSAKGHSEQARQFANSSTDLASGEARKQFDTPGDDKGAVRYPAVKGQTPAVAALAAKIPPVAKVRGDRQVKETMAWYQHLDGLKTDAEKKLAELIAQRKNGPVDASGNSAQVATLMNQVQQYAAQQAWAEEQLKKRVIDLGYNWNEGTTPGGSAAAASASGTSSTSK